MLIPRFSVRSLLLATVAVALYCLCLTLAINGQLWAVGVFATLNAILGLLLLHALAFLVTVPVAWGYSIIQEQQRPTNPFATEQPPPQVVPPQEPE